MRSLIRSTIIMTSLLLSSSPHAGALSMLQTDENSESHAGTPATAQAEPETAVPAIEATQSAYLEKPALRDVTEAIRQNRQHRRMFADLTKGSGRAQTALTKYIRALDVRFAILSAVGNGLVKATTEAEIDESEAVARAVLSIRTDLDRAIDATQMAVIDSARTSGGYFGACDNRGELADGTKCVMASEGVTSEGEPKQFWVQPWDAERFEAVVSAR